jgi:putative endonuclease
MRDHSYFVYMMASKRNGTLYVGVTNNVMRRAAQHKFDAFEGFTKQYGVHRLVWYEHHDDIRVAISREKRIKKWNRAWKVALIEEENPNWTDLHWKFMHVIDTLNTAFIAALDEQVAVAKGESPA